MFYPITINDFDRKAILVLGDFPFDRKPFETRNLILKNITLKDISGSSAEVLFNTCKAIIVANHPGKYNLIKSFSSSIFPFTDNYGILNKILVHTEKDILQTSAILRNPSTDYVFYPKQIDEIAESLARYSPGPPAEAVIIESKSELSEEVKLLLRRSFFGCERIFVESISGGRASLGLYKVYAWMGNSLVGPAPCPFFAKIAPHKEIKIELEKYRAYTDLFISFQYRPNCRIERCTSTKTYSSLIGNFVDEAISFQSALRDTHHAGIIFSLFEKSLKSLRQQPFVSKKRPTEGVLKGFVKERVWIEKLMEREDLISTAKDLGLKSDIIDLHAHLLENCPKQCIMGPFHGDLNFRNVMVKGNDAIVIDFSTVESSGPLTADPATLEISLCFEASDKFAPPFSRWKKFIDEAYDPNNILKPLSHSEQVPSEFTWLRRAVREIRHVLVGCHCEREEIKVIIATYLMRIARLAPDNYPDKRLKLEFKYRAYALVIAERIIESLVKQKEQKSGNVRKIRKSSL